jgi:hypothetical protein
MVLRKDSLGASAGFVHHHGVQLYTMGARQTDRDPNGDFFLFSDSEAVLEEMLRHAGRNR